MRAWILRASRVATLCLGLSPLPVGAEPGLSISWDDCGPVGSVDKEFTCDTNTGERFSLILGVRPPPGVLDFIGFVGVVDFDFESQVTPSWWDFPGCRVANDLIATQASDLTCPDISATPFYMAWDYAFAVGYPGRSRFRIAASVAVEDVFPLTADSLVALCRVSIGRRNTVGDGACEGCSVPACIAFSSVLMDVLDASAPRVVLTMGPKQFVRWQNTIACPFVGSPATKSTWGQLKSLYR